MCLSAPLKASGTLQKFLPSFDKQIQKFLPSFEAGKELLYLLIIMREFGFPQAGPSHLFEDSRAVIAMAENPSNRKGVRHIDMREHFIDQLVNDHIIKLVQSELTRW